MLKVEAVVGFSLMTLYELWGLSWHGYTRLAEESNTANCDSHTLARNYGK